MSASAVARGRGYLSRGVLLAGISLAAVSASGFLAWSLMPRHKQERATHSAGGPGSGFSMGRPMTQLVSLGSVNVGAPPGSPPASSTTPAQVTAPALTPRARMLGFWDDGSESSALPKPEPVRATGASDPSVATPSPGQGQSEFSQRMQTTRTDDSEPVPHRFHKPYTIAKGTIFPCLPTQPISSELPGPVQCIVSVTGGQGVMSMDGSTVLLPNGTQVNGMVERGLSGGDQRLFLVWTDALTPKPDQLPIPLDAPAADEMGQVGVPGDVNDHLWRRIRGALLLTVVQTASNVAVAAAQNGNNNTYLGGIGNSVPSLAQMAFGRDVNIPSTLYRGPAQPLSVYVNKYIDLHNFYQNREVSR